MAPRITYHNARSAVYDVQKEMEAEGLKPAVARPWNMYEPDTTFWWLVPSTDWPAYKHGKLFFAPEPRASEGCLLCGLHIEKGIHPSVAEAYPSSGGRRLVMKDDWIWHGFYDELTGERLPSAIGNVSKATGAPVIFRIEAGYVEDPGSFDPQAERFKWDTVIFETSGDSLDITTCDTPSRLLTGIKEVNTLEDLARAIPGMKNIHWYWIDVFIGSAFRADAGDSETWNSSSMWRNALSAWKPWFK